MVKLSEKIKVLSLRKEGKSYSQIRNVVKVSKGTLSRWLENYPLSKERIRTLQALSEQRIEHFRETMTAKRELRLRRTYEKEKKKWLPLSKRELFLTGLFLYWGEGTKARKSELVVSNTDPKVITFALYWFTKSLKIPKNKIKVLVHLYEDMDIKQELLFWSKLTKIPLSQFRKPYIKKTSLKSINYKGTFGHGTCNIRAGNTKLTEKILMALKAVGDHYNINSKGV